MGANGECTAALFGWIPRRVSGRGNPVQVPSRASQRCEVGAKPSLGEAANEVDLEPSYEVGQFVDGGQFAELIAAEGACQVLGG